MLGDAFLVDKDTVLATPVDDARPVPFGEYDRVATARGEAALAQVDGEVCGSCYQTLTTQMMNVLYLSKPLFCKSCGALLYLPEDTSV